MDYMSDEESDQDTAGVHYLTVRTPTFRPSIIKKLFDCLDELAQKLAEHRRGSLLRNVGQKYERYPAIDGVPSEQRPPAYLPRDCYDNTWLTEDPWRERVLQPAPAMNIRRIFEGLNGN